jgi:site-specific recombinase XerD
MLTSWQRSMRARNLAAKTITVYTAAGRELARWLDAETEIRGFEDVRKGDLEGWIASLLDAGSAGYASNRYRAVQQLFKWLTDEEEIAVNPMARMTPPKVDEKLVPVLSDEQIRALFKTCTGTSFVARRDYALLRLFLATGVRLAEMAGLESADLDLDERCAVVTGKERRSRIVRFDAETCRALDRYERLREKDRRAGEGAYWLSEKGRGPMSSNGIYQMVKRRGRLIGLDLHPHMFRHTFAHRFQSKGGAEGDLMELAGWRSPQMVRRYGASARGERARTSYGRVGVMTDL